MRLYPLAPVPAEPTPTTRTYPCSLTDAEWAVLAPLLQRPATPKGAGHPNTRCGPSSTRSATWCARAAPGGCCHASSHRRARCTGGLPSGPPTAPCNTSTTPSASRSASPLAAGRPHRGDHRLAIGPRGRHRPTGQPRLGRRQEGQRPQTPPGRGHLGAAAGGLGDRQRPGPRRRPAPAVAAALGLSRRPAVLGRCRLRRQTGRLGGRHAALGPADRAQAPWPVDLRGPAAPMGGGADACLDQQAPPHRARLRGPARPSCRDGHLGHGRGHDSTSCSSSPTTICPGNAA